MKWTERDDKMVEYLNLIWTRIELENQLRDNAVDCIVSALELGILDIDEIFDKPKKGVYVRNRVVNERKSPYGVFR